MAALAAWLLPEFEVLVRALRGEELWSVRTQSIASSVSLLTVKQIAIKTMKKTFDSFAPCLELREVIFLRTLPTHPHLVPALDIFLDPLSKKLHICMEYMDGNLYQLMKARDHKCLDGRSVKSILFQILAGLNHIHAHKFFHRDIKPENILVSTSAPHDCSSTFSRYSALVTPPSTPPTYTIKIADFGLARETHSRLPYTTYVSTRWYRAPEVLLRAGEYSAPVDIWAIGAMAVEIATLKPLFPGGNEVDQVWRVCEIMGSPGNWYNKSGARVGGGDWREGTRLAQKLGFSFPKVSIDAVSFFAVPNMSQMAPHSMDSILQAPQWPTSFSNFVTWCLMWDPKNRPNSVQALEHEYFADAVDPLRPKSSTARLLGRKHSDRSFKSSTDALDSPAFSSKPSWFRRSLIARDSAPAVPQHDPDAKPIQVPSMYETEAAATNKPRPTVNKRSTWAHGTAPTIGAPMPILPSIRPISPLSNAVTAQASGHVRPGAYVRAEAAPHANEEKAKKIGRQLSMNSHGNHYADSHAERGLNGSRRSPLSPMSAQKESFFSHLRKRARRLSGRHGVTSPHADDLEANVAGEPWSKRSSIVGDIGIREVSDNDFTELDKALQSVRYSLEHSSKEPRALPAVPAQPPSLKRHHSLNQANAARVTETPTVVTPISSRTRRALQMTSHPVHRYETPEEEDELLDEVLNSANAAANRLAHYSKAEEKKQRSALTQKVDNHQTMPKIHMPGDGAVSSAYPTPSPSAKRNGVLFGLESVTPSQPLAITKQHAEFNHVDPQWPTPPYEEKEWAAAAAASIFAAGMVYR